MSLDLDLIQLKGNIIKESTIISDSQVISNTLVITTVPVEAEIPSLYLIFSVPNQLATQSIELIKTFQRGVIIPDIKKVNPLPIQSRKSISCTPFTMPRGKTTIIIMMMDT